jgi:hypothetical protein
MEKYLCPKDDMPFKRVCGKYPDLLKNFLVEIEGEKSIESAKELMKTVQQFLLHKQAILDKSGVLKNEYKHEISI